MQDKEVVFKESEESPGKKDKKTESQSKDRKDSSEESKKKHQHNDTKDGKFQFKRMKQPKTGKHSKKSASRFEGEGVSFKAKLIGVDEVPDPRGDKMCQDSMQRLKLSVKALGPHKRKIVIFVSLQGIKIKDEKTTDLLYHHPVSQISFISQDITDARAFGYVAGSHVGQHDFIAIKTEKPAFHVVVALRDLFQTVLNWKKEEMHQAKQAEQDQDAASSAGSESLQEKTSVNENLTDSVSEEEKSTKEENIYFDVILAEPFQLAEPETSPKTVDDLLDLQDELNKLQQGIAQMDTSIAAATYSFGDSVPTKDPFDTSFVTPSGPKIDAYPPPMPAPVPLAATAVPVSPQFPTSFDSPLQDKYAIFNTMDFQPSIFTGESPQATDAIEPTFIPDLNDLEEEIKKKSSAPAKPPRHSKAAASPDPLVFADLDPLGKDRPYVDKAEFFQDVKNPPKKVLNDLVSNGEERTMVVGSPPHAVPSPPRHVASPISNGLTSSSSLPNSSFLNNFSVSFPRTPFNPFEKEVLETSTLPDNAGSSPIPIPTRNRDVETKDCSPSSRSPGSLEPQMPNGSSPVANGYSPNSKTQNGVYRPRPRPSSLNKGSSVPSSSTTVPPVPEMNMQSIANILRLNGHRSRAGSFPVTDSDIFTKKGDPFGDDFFCSLPKRVPNHLAKTEIRDYV